jgi:hypothetical protein
MLAAAGCASSSSCCDERSLRINEALALDEANLDPRRGSLLVRRAKGDRVAKSGCTIGPGSSSRSG